MSILRIRDASGEFVAVPAIRGEKGEKGEKGDRGESGGVTAVNGIAPDGSGNVRLEWPVNLLDNSDFRNPVNQRGQSCYETEWGMTIDRWYLQGSGEGTKLTVTDEGVKLTPPSGAEVSIQQRLEYVDTDRDHTLAVYTLDGTLHVVALSASELQSRVTQVGFAYAQMTFTSETTVVWAALYEGSFTAATMPPYRAKGYGAELMECQRYYRTIRVMWGTELGGTQRQLLNYAPTMRVFCPTVTFAVETENSAQDAELTVNGVDWSRVDVSGTSYGHAVIALSAEL